MRSFSVTVSAFAFLVFVPGLCAAAPRVVLSIRPIATVSATVITLGDVAAIKTADRPLSQRLAAVPLGSAPLPGETRPLTTGDIALKLRQAGIDPEMVSFSGASALSVTAAPSGAVSAPVNSTIPAVSAAEPAASAALMNAVPVIHAGDPVSLVWQDGLVTVSASVVAVSGGALGATITVRRDGATNLLQGVVVDAQTVRLSS